MDLGLLDAIRLERVGRCLPCLLYICIVEN